MIQLHEYLIADNIESFRLGVDLMEHLTLPELVEQLQLAASKFSETRVNNTIVGAWTWLYAQPGARTEILHSIHYLVLVSNGIDIGRCFYNWKTLERPELFSPDDRKRLIIDAFKSTTAYLNT